MIERLFEFYPELAIKIFVDCDPYGLDIYRIYKQVRRDKGTIKIAIMHLETSIICIE
jgi:DNA topoisomerase VI subunit A